VNHVVETSPGEFSLYVGGVFASRTPANVRTILGSCIAVCLYDPVARVGGMNHFLLPAAKDDDGFEVARFGVHAMDSLIGELMMRHKADRRRLVAKVFGGGHVLDTAHSTDSVPERNIRFIRDFLRDEEIPVVAEDLGGTWPRLVIFHCTEGRARVKRMTGTRVVDALRVRDTSAAKETPQYGSVDLF